MKLTLKTTALSILVALGVTACNGGGGAGAPSSPVNLNTQNGSSLPSGDTPPTSNNGPSASGNGSTVSGAAPSTTGGQPSTSGAQPTTHIANKLDKHGVEWRQITPLNGSFLYVSEYDRVNSSKTTHGESGLWGPASNEIVNDTVNQSISISLNDLTPNLLGEHKGVYRDQRFNFEDAPKELNYHIVNQPYSSYGIFFNDKVAAPFAFIQDAGVGLAVTEDGLHEFEEYNVGKNYNNWNDNVVGDATYKGKVVADIYNGKTSQYKLDGDVTLNAHFDANSRDKSYVSGHIDSQTLGKIELSKAEFGGVREDSVWQEKASATYQGVPIVGNYYLQFGGKDLNDVIGSIELRNNRAGIDIESYKAVFGATKQ